MHRTGGLTIGYLPQEVETIREGTVLRVVLEGAAEIVDVERRLRVLEAELTAARPGDPRTEALTATYGDLRHRFEVLGGDHVEAKARAILSGLGVEGKRFHEPLARCPAGWRMRVVLARLLLGAPDLLLLDEPTNHLDLEAIDWLETFLADFEGAFIVVSHDRYFLNRMVRAVAELDRGRLTRLAGDYDDYLEAKEGADAAREKAARPRPRRSRGSSASSSASATRPARPSRSSPRVKALEKVERIEAPQRRQDDPLRLSAGTALGRHRGARRGDAAKAFGDARRLRRRRPDPAPRRSPGARGSERRRQDRRS